MRMRREEKSWKEKRKEERQREDSKKETWRAACNLLHPKLSGDAPPRRVVAANPPSRGCACEGQSGRGVESNRLARGHRASALWNHLQTCVLIYQIWLLFVPDLTCTELHSLTALFAIIIFISWLNFLIVLFTGENTCHQEYIYLLVLSNAIQATMVADQCVLLMVKQMHTVWNQTQTHLANLSKANATYQLLC